MSDTFYFISNSGSKEETNDKRKELGQKGGEVNSG